MPVPGTGMTGLSTSLIPLGSELGSAVEVRLTRTHRNSDRRAASVPRLRKQDGSWTVNRAGWGNVSHSCCYGQCCFCEEKLREVMSYIKAALSLAKIIFRIAIVVQYQQTLAFLTACLHRYRYFLV